MRHNFLLVALPLSLLVVTVGCYGGTSVVVRDPYYQSAYAGSDGDRFVAMPFKRTIFSADVELDPDSCVECSVMPGTLAGGEVASLAFNLPFTFTNRGTEAWVITRNMFSLRRQLDGVDLSLDDPEFGEFRSGVDGDRGSLDPAVPRTSALGAPDHSHPDTVLFRVPPGASGTLPMRFLLSNYVLEEDAFGEYIVTVRDESGALILEEKLLIKAYQPVLQVVRFSGVVLLLIGLGAIA